MNNHDPETSPAMRPGDQMPVRQSVDGTTVNEPIVQIAGDFGGSLMVGGTHIHPRPQVSWPVRYGLVPRLAAHHQVRDVDLPGESTLVLVSADDDTADRADAGSLADDAGLVVSGMGGVGKTQIAAHAAHRAKGSVDLLLWITATSRDAVIAAYSDTARKILIAEEGWDSERGARTLLEWLATTERPWLVVLDDVPSPHVLNELWPPDSQVGRTIVTTRHRGHGLTGRGRRVAEVGVFTSEQSRTFLRAELAGSPHSISDSDLDELAADLGHLPLALAHAAAYVISRRQSVSTYLALLADHRRTVQAVFPKQYELGEGHARTIAATWQVSVDLAGELLAGTAPAGTAHAVMRVAALLDPNGTPTEVFSSAPVLRYLTGANSDESTGDQIEEALHVLDQLNLLTVDLEGRQTRIHGLVQRVVRDTLIDEEGRAVLARSVADGLLQTWFQGHISAASDPLFEANAVHLIQHTGEHLHHPETHDLLLQLGHSFRNAGQLTRAAAHQQDLYATLSRLRGPDHFHTLLCRGELARLRAMAGQPADAVTEFEQLLTDCARVLGNDHRHTLGVRGHLALCRGSAGKPAEALEEYEALLTDAMRVLGPYHRETLSARGNIARTKGDLGDHVGAIAAFEALLPELERTAGADHPDALAVRANIANQRGEAGHPAAAVAELEQLLADTRRINGNDHPDTFIVRGNLASWKGHAGNAVGAVRDLRSLLADRLRVLGPDHPSTFINRANLAYWWGTTAGPRRAIKEYETLLADQTRVMGPNHPNTLITRGNLADTRGKAGYATEAILELRAVLADARRTLGPKHPTTLAVWSKLAETRTRDGDTAEAIREYKELLAEMLTTHRRDHPEVLAVRANLAHLRADLGDPASMIPEYEDLLADSLRVLGTGNRNIFAVRYNLASLRGDAGNTAHAIAEYEAMLADIVRVSGPHHADARCVQAQLDFYRA